LYEDFWLRVDFNEWKKFLHSLSLNESVVLHEISVAFFNTHFCLPHDVWRLLDNELALVDSNDFRWEFLLDWRHDMCSDLPTLLVNESEFDEALYADLRMKAYLEQLGGQPEQAAAYARQATLLFGKDRKLLLILGDSLCSMRQYSQAVVVYRKTLDLQPNASIRFKIAELLFEMGEYQQAEQECRHLVSDPYYQEETKALKLLCDWKLGRYTKIGYRLRKYWLQSRSVFGLRVIFGATMVIVTTFLIWALLYIVL
jgi:tetratricopeptide (TPR) repeat protein